MASIPALTLEDLAADLSFMRQVGAYRPALEAARSEDIPPALFLAIASRESRGGRLIAGRGWRGDRGHGHSIWQVDDRSWPGVTRRADPANHARYARFAAAYLRDLKNDLGTWRQAVPAYNAGPHAVRSAMGQGQAPDTVTTGANYGADVSRRAQLIRELVPEFREQRSIPLQARLGAAGIGAMLFLGYRYFKR